jgi:hypothetical protein
MITQPNALRILLRSVRTENAESRRAKLRTTDESGAGRLRRIFVNIGALTIFWHPTAAYLQGLQAAFNGAQATHNPLEKSR